MTTPNSYANAYTGTANITDRLVQPWYIPGWEAQNIPQDTVVAPSPNFSGVNFPTNLAFVNVTANYVDTNSSGIGGFLTFMMSDNITVLDGGQYYRLPKRFTGTMNQRLSFAYNNWGNGPVYLYTGRLDCVLFATDQTTSGSTITTDGGGPFFYWVTEHFLGGRQYQITVPSSDATAPVDINSLIVTGTIKEYDYDPVFPMTDMWIPTDTDNDGDSY
jgi:hypothetical protein